MDNDKSNADNYIVENKQNDEIDFGEIFQKLKRRKKIIYSITLSFFMLITVYTAIKRVFKPVFLGNFSLLINNPIQQTSSSDKSSFLEGLPNNFDLINKIDPKADINTIIKILESRSYLNPIAKEYKITTKSLKKRLKINPVYGDRSKPTGIINVSFLVLDRKKDLKLLNKLKDTFLLYSFNEKQKDLKNNLEFFEMQLPILEKERSNLYKKLANLRIENSILEPLSEGESIMEVLTSLELNVGNLNSNIESLEDLKEKLKTYDLGVEEFILLITNIQTFNDEAQLPGIETSNYFRMRFKEILKLEEKLNNAKTFYVPSSSKIKSLEIALNELGPFIKKQQNVIIDEELSNNKIKLDKVNKQKKYLDDIYLKRPLLFEEYEKLNLSLLKSTARLTDLLDIKQKTKLEISRAKEPWKLINNPKIDQKVISPDFSKSLAIGLIGGLIIGIIIAYIRDNFDDSYHQSSSIKRDLRVPIFGELPFIDRLEEFKSGKNYYENLNNLYKNKKFEKFKKTLINIFNFMNILEKDNNISSICFSSIERNSGSSTMLIFLGKLLSEIGKKVLIIDANFRKPTINIGLGLDNSLGLENVLKDNKLNWQNYIKESPDNKNLFVISSGQTQEDRIKIFSSKTFVGLLQDIKSSGKFDFIIIDSPNLKDSPETFSLATITDGIALLVPLDNVSRKNVTEAISKLVTKNIKVLGIVSSKINIRIKHEKFKNNNSLFSKILTWVDS